MPDRKKSDRAEGETKPVEPRDPPWTELPYFAPGNISGMVKNSQARTIRAIQAGALRPKGPHRRG